MREWILKILREIEIDSPVMGDLGPMADQVICFIEELRKWNQKINLTSEKEEEFILKRHFYDSLHFAKALHEAGDTLDIGSGAGFPGIPLKIVFPKMSMVLVESQRKRANFLKHVVRKMEFKNIEVVQERAENLAREKVYQDNFDYVLFRAVSKLEICLELGAPYLREGGKIIVKKGLDAEIPHKTISMNPALSLIKEIPIKSWFGVESKLMVFQKCST